MHGSQRIIVVLITLLLIAPGCSAIRSEAVRGLIHKEHATIDRAQTNIDLFQKQTGDRITYLKKALEELDKANQSLQQVETLHQVVFSSYQNVEHKQGQDAHSAAYLLGKIYLTQYEGLQRKVLDQFEEDFCALREIAARLGTSWKGIGTIHHQIQRYANQSFFASVDPQLVAAVADQVPGASHHLRTVLENSRHVNDALDEALNFSFLPGRALGRTRSVTLDLVELLERLKKD